MTASLHTCDISFRESVMNTTANDSYLATEVLTASPQRLHLMLIDGAIRNCNRTLHCWENKEYEPAFEALLRAQKIVSEILGTIDFEADTDLIRKVAGVYTFIYRCLTEAALSRNASKVADALRVLTVERETWQQVCEKSTKESTSISPAWSAAASNDSDAADFDSGSFSADQHGLDHLDNDDYGGGFSLDA